MTRTHRYQEILDRLPAHQHSTFMPQVEQFNVEIIPTRFGVLGKVNIPQANGWCWAASIDDDRLISIVRIAISEEFAFHEHPEIEYSCLSLLSTASAQIMDAIWAYDRTRPNSENVVVHPSSAPLLEADSERAMAFTMHPRRYDSPLAAGTIHAGVSVHLLPSYFEKLDRAYPGEFGNLKKSFDQRVDLTDALELRSILRSITPRQSNYAGARLHYEGKALEAVSAFAAFLNNSPSEQDRSETTLGDRVKTLLANSLDKPPTLDELAAACYTSRTSLCNNFKRECGISVGTYLNDLRIAQAKELLANTNLSVADIARRIGYRHASTFVNAFKQAETITPSKWRSMRNAS